ncbi:LptF/LptG family permease [Oculatella sp. FACHB-28]|uniref:LptF/LptG family permease n=1 Tax=Cyanophyceae TaxID=3028117 RepID=UPI001682B407|nr:MULTISPECIES: LptF/LptG family permease [Cyanophyceae]MBD1870440.1 LptF/LptG family permease [Cyanobacteria bacterium FACHB-471]MBD1996715.1 LptF/LptG family permease [Leptolyngbya sp. FACHB-541]MBD2055568.1 LptF/LptG family permease [Oculatella sp. FACHB-28]MBD2069935.1 LptF/LptG family permease [Leptolyngbya sp. FACHB-671]
MDRYIATELTLPFLFGVGIFSSLGVSVGALFDLIRRVTESGLPISTAVEILALNFPQFMVYGFPASSLLATLMTYGRLSTDSELVALRGCGISVFRLVLPAVVLCTIVTGLTFVFNELIVPAANYRAATTLERALGDERPEFQEENIFYQEFQEFVEDDGDRKQRLARLFYAREFNGREMQGLTILDFSREGLNQIVSAKSAIWNLAQSTWDFFDGTIYVVSSDGSFRNIVTFEQQQIQLPRTPLDLASRGRDYDEMNIKQSLDYMALLQQGGDEAKIRKLRVRIQQKYSLPFVCVAFGLVGAALGTRSRRTGRATGFAISLVIIFGYYLSAVVTGSLAQNEVLSPFMGAWLPNLLGLVAGGFLLVRASR